MKKIIAVLAVILMITAVLTACNKKKDDPSAADGATRDSVSSGASGTVRPSATTAVVETTAQGGTVEKDDEGNTIEIDSSGTITSIRNADGESIEITVYLETHCIVSANGTVYGKAKAADGQSGQSGSPSDASSKSESKASSSQSEKKQDEETHSVEMPDGSDEYELPIIK